MIQLLWSHWQQLVTGIYGVWQEQATLVPLGSEVTADCHCLLKLYRLLQEELRAAVALLVSSVSTLQRVRVVKGININYFFWNLIYCYWGINSTIAFELGPHIIRDKSTGTTLRAYSFPWSRIIQWYDLWYLYQRPFSFPWRSVDASSSRSNEPNLLDSVVHWKVTKQSCSSLCSVNYKQKYLLYEFKIVSLDEWINEYICLPFKHTGDDLVADAFFLVYKHDDRGNSSGDV